MQSSAAVAATTPSPSVMGSGSLPILTPQASTTTSTSATAQASSSSATAPSSQAAGTDGSSSSSTFEFPPEYSFPPFFTRQTNLTTHRAQLDKWSSLVLAYTAHHRLFRLSLSAPATAELFHNRKLNRKLSAADAREVLEFMRRDGRAEPIVPSGSKDKDAAATADVWWVFWRTPDEWAALVETWVDETAQKGTVLTLYELTDGEGSRGAEFHGLDSDLLLKALQVLVKRGKAQIFGQEDQQGVKFF